jgi:hypothetical protein
MEGCRWKAVKMREGDSPIFHVSLFPSDQTCRPVALTARASDSKSEGGGFKSLLACHIKWGRMIDRED